MKFSTTGQENGDLLIQVTTWAGLTVQYIYPEEGHQYANVNYLEWRNTEIH